MDVDENEAAGAEYQIQAMPTFVLVKVRPLLCCIPVLLDRRCCELSHCMGSGVEYQIQAMPTFVLVKVGVALCTLRMARRICAPLGRSCMLRASNVPTPAHQRQTRRSALSPAIAFKTKPPQGGSVIATVIGADVAKIKAKIEENK